MEIDTGIAGDTVDAINDGLFLSTTLTKNHLPDVIEDERSSWLNLEHETATTSTNT